ncbi:hypothetical protein FSP39_014267 [Pinctada imbricata]|uniref:Uncharacterized protein n=1 Tax=Pinctada imbricata TaxID=66713 RepID=A0AA88YR97_PINIB|nr:hypothetical protein FSP39_014267 [Pinctada imbricata]
MYKSTRRASVSSETSGFSPQCPRLQSTVKYCEGNWTFVSELPVLPSFVYAFTLHGKLLCFAFEMLKWTMSFGNQHESTESGGLYEYDPYRDKWLVLTHNVSPTVLTAVKDCASRYGTFTCCKDTNTLYCVTYSKNMKVKIGMTDGEIELNESMDLLAIEDFPESTIENPASVVMDRDLYVIGGLQKYSQSDVKVLSEVYRLDPNNSSWVSLAAMNIARSACAAVALGGHLYVIGGFGRFRLSSAERYDPSVDQWTNLTRMTKERSHLNAIVMTDKIYVMGGKSYGIAGGGVRKVLRSVEEYDPDKDTWTTIEPMPQNRCLFGAVVW